MEAKCPAGWFINCGIYNGISYSNENEQTPVVCTIKDESHIMMSKISNTQRQLLTI